MSGNPALVSSPHVFVCGFEDCDRVFSKASRLLHHRRTHTGERPYMCPDLSCGKKYTRSAHLNRHMEQVHSDVRSPRCSCTIEGCGQTFATLQNYQKHMNRKHDTAKWKCPEVGCQERFRKHHQLKAHVFSHKGVLPFQCDKEDCRKKFKQKSHLDRHIKIHQGYKCPEEGCLEIFHRWSDVRKHRAVDHRIDNKCGECNATVTSHQWLKKHKATHSPYRSKYVCPHDDCDRSYSETRNLNAHIRAIHEGHRFLCGEENCNKSFSTKQKLQNHHRLVHDPHASPKPKYKRLNLHRKTSFASKLTGVKDGTLPVPPRVDEEDNTDCMVELSSNLEEEPQQNQQTQEDCVKLEHKKGQSIEYDHVRHCCTTEGCGQTFSTLQNYQKHVKRKHDTAKWKCPEEGCEERFRKHHQLKAHVYSHKGVLPFQCDKEGCHKNFKQKSHLDRHMKIHQGYKCPEEGCLKIFHRWSDVRKHRAAEHRIEKKCEECSKTFSSFYQLKMHKETHNPNRSKYLCTYDGCNRSYSEKRNLSTHIHITHEGQRFICWEDSCGKAFSTKQKCQQHQKVAHGCYAASKLKDGGAVPVPVPPNVKEEEDCKWKVEVTSGWEEELIKSPELPKQNQQTEVGEVWVKMDHIPSTEDSPVLLSETLENPAGYSDQIINICPKEVEDITYKEAPHISSASEATDANRDMGAERNTETTENSANEACSDSGILIDLEISEDNTTAETLNTSAHCADEKISAMQDSEGEMMVLTDLKYSPNLQSGKDLDGESTEHEMELSNISGPFSTTTSEKTL